MKKTLITMTLLMALALGMEASAQQHRHTPRTQEELVDSASKDAVVAYSDTTTAAVAGTTAKTGSQADDDDEYYVNVNTGTSLDKWIGDMPAEGFWGMVFALSVLFILFILAPVFILATLFYFINKNRKQRIRLAEMAMQQGQPIPNSLLDDKPGSVTDDYQRGLRQCFVGVGLMIFLGLAAKEIGFGIGALVFCIGLGKIVAAKTVKKTEL